MADRAFSNDVHTMMLFDANKKSAGIAYALWFFVGMAGGHRFYVGRNGTAVVMIALFIFGLATLVMGGGLLLLADAIWVLIDAFMIPGWVRAHNMNLISKLSGETNWHQHALGVA